MGEDGCGVDDGDRSVKYLEKDNTFATLGESVIVDNHLWSYGNDMGAKMAYPAPREGSFGILTEIAPNLVKNALAWQRGLWDRVSYFSLNL